MRKQKFCVGIMILALCATMFAGCGSKTAKGTESGTETETGKETETAKETESAGSETEKVSETVSESEAAKKPEKDKLNDIPSKFRSKNDQAGTVITISYETDAYGETMTKEANVYLPYGYDDSNKYDIFYMMHGGGGSIEEYIKPDPLGTQTSKLFDNMIAYGKMDPFIMVAPTYYGGSGSDAQLVEKFCQDELPNDLIPAIEGMFSTYAESTDPEDLKAARDHRAYSGFSMGSLSTWCTFLYCEEYFRYFLPLSGDCWVNGSQNPVEGAKLLEKTVKEKGYGENDFFIYAITGDQDMAYDPMKNQMAQMDKYSPSFHFVTKDEPNGNICFRVHPGAYHATSWMPMYFYNALPTFWKGEPVYQ